MRAVMRRRLNELYAYSGGNDAIKDWSEWSCLRYLFFFLFYKCNRNTKQITADDIFALNDRRIIEKLSLSKKWLIIIKSLCSLHFTFAAWKVCYATTSLPCCFLIWFGWFIAARLKLRLHDPTPGPCTSPFLDPGLMKRRQSTSSSVG